MGENEGKDERGMSCGDRREPGIIIDFGQRASVEVIHGPASCIFKGFSLLRADSLLLPLGSIRLTLLLGLARRDKKKCRCS